ncbi:hypothetical protein HPB48_015322 [Haemaphysalis longicornis]|uniref:Uncharacterized protein n=1 Tax=Haemaphysalis longicornis TaxID=44386 RepID=A0A9J6GNT8_HAELO|nr:hypothetical protein HPB48_015322 [Haemaphysalis longicornis]
MPGYDPNSDTSSATTLSEDTRTIVSFWHRYLSQRNLQCGSDASQSSTAALVRDYLAGIPCPSRSNDSENISERGLSAFSEQGFRRQLPDHPTGWSSVLALTLLVLATSLVLVAMLLTVYNIQPASSVFGTDAEVDIKPSEADSNRPSLIAAPAAPAFKAGQRLPPQQPLVTTRESRRMRSETVHAVARLDVPIQAPTTVMRDNFSTGYGEISEAKLVCGAVYYSYCTRSTSKFYYDPWEKACTASRGNNGALCLKGSNRFPSKGSCKRTCVLSERSSPRCAGAATFTSCTRSDYRGSSLWYFNGRACRLWEFPAGQCPSRAEGAVLFRTSEKCEEKCGNVSSKGTPPRPPNPACRVPGSVRCRPDELRYTYFAVTSATRSRCVPTTAPALARRRCLSGANRFSTRASCEKMCVRKLQHSPVE